MTDRKQVTIPIAYGSPETGAFALTPPRPLRKWPNWTLRPHMPEGSLMARRFDYGDEGNDLTPGTPYAEAIGAEYDKFIRDTHTKVGVGVFVLEIVKRDVHFFPDVVSFYRFQGNVSRWLDALPKDKPIVFPEVINAQFCEMLHRRGFKLASMWDDTAHDDDWIPVHARGALETKDY